MQPVTFWLRCTCETCTPHTFWRKLLCGTKHVMTTTCTIRRKNSMSVNSMSQALLPSFKKYETTHNVHEVAVDGGMKRVLERCVELYYCRSVLADDHQHLLSVQLPISAVSVVIITIIVKLAILLYQRATSCKPKRHKAPVLHDIVDHLPVIQLCARNHRAADVRSCYVYLLKT